MSRAAWIAVGGVSALAFGLAAALAISLASGDDDRGERPPAGPGLVAPGGAPSEELQECLSEQGVEIPEPGSRGPLQGQGRPEGLEEAFEACRELLPEGGEGGFRIVPPG